MRFMVRRGAALLVLSTALVACRDPESGGMARGPTKAPGDSVPLLFINNEEPTDMRALGTPNRPTGEALVFPEDTTTAGAAAAPASGSKPAAKPAVAVTLPQGVTQAMVDEGKKTFDTICFACHGQGGAGGPLAPKLADNQWLHIKGSYDEIVTIVTNGVPKPLQFPAPMPPKGGSPLTDAQVKAVAAYVFSISR